jgi:hypothetical protein
VDCPNRDAYTVLPDDGLNPFLHFPAGSVRKGKAQDFVRLSITALYDIGNPNGQGVCLSRPCWRQKQYIIRQILRNGLLLGVELDCDWHQV